MTEGSAAKLYTGEVLGLATQLARYPLKNEFEFQGEARSRTCGSSLSIELDTNEDGAITELGMQVSACAIGQAAAAIFAQDAKGRTVSDLDRSRIAIEQWLEGNSDMPDWPGLSAIAPAQVHTARHGAILLAWNAACEALSTGAFHR